MTETQRAWLITALAVILIAVILWGAPHYVVYWKNVVANGDLQAAATKAVQSIMANGVR